MHAPAKIEGVLPVQIAGENGLLARTVRSYVEVTPVAGEGSLFAQLLEGARVAEVANADALTIRVVEGRTLIVLKKPAPCRCGRMAALMVNENGRTHCYACEPSDDCNGHPAGSNGPGGETVYCDGSCRKGVR